MSHNNLLIVLANMPIYNTIMATATGIALCSMVNISHHLCFKTKLNPQGWTFIFAVLGCILFLTSLHLSVSWPLDHYLPFSMVVFSKSSLIFGLILVVISFYMWKNREIIKTVKSPMMSVANDLRHYKYILYGLGLALIGIAIANISNELISNSLNDTIIYSQHSVVALVISGLWTILGIATMLCPFVFERFAHGRRGQTLLVKVTYKLIHTSGVIFLLYGFINYFMHVGLIVNTLPK